MTDVTQADCAVADTWVREWKHCEGWHPELLNAFARHRQAAIEATFTRLLELAGDEDVIQAAVTAKAEWVRRGSDESGWPFILTAILEKAKEKML